MPAVWPSCDTRACKPQTVVVAGHKVLPFGERQQAALHHLWRGQRIGCTAVPVSDDQKHHGSNKHKREGRSPGPRSPPSPPERRHPAGGNVQQINRQSRKPICSAHRTS